MMRFKLYGTILLIGLACLLITSFVSPKKKAENNPPKVIITNPKNDDQFSWNSTIRYSITITDNEDGFSEYNEINGREVSLEVCYLPDASKVKKYLADKKKINKEPVGFTMLKNSDCFTCHASKNKLIGPSFEKIAKRYPFNRNSLERLTKNVIKGSSGIWGKVPMPAHKTIKAEEVKQMISWILANNSNPNLTFYPGTEGAFRIKEKSAKENGKGVIVLTAGYTDHGEKSSMQNKKYGQHSIILKLAN